MHDIPSPKYFLRGGNVRCWFLFLHNIRNVFSNDFWVHTVLLIMLHLTDTPRDASTILIITENTFLTHLCKSCADVT